MKNFLVWLMRKKNLMWWWTKKTKKKYIKRKMAFSVSYRIFLFEFLTFWVNRIVRKGNIFICVCWQVEAINLKTEFTLPVVNMPKFDFVTTSPKKPIPISETSPPRHDNASQSSSVSSMEFTFSNPIPSTKPDFSPGAGTPKLVGDHSGW